RCALSVLNISADQSQLSVMVSHLIRNACEAVLARKSLNEENFSGQVTVILKTDRRCKTAELTVTDNGGGLNDEKIRQHLFDPFFSGRQAGRGLGFGLCLCRQIVESHHGIIMFHQYSSDRAEFFVAIPLTEQSSEVTGIGWSITECF
ncbi:MAG: ATP-binding protein, partial [Phycisphaerae bacterium]